MFEELEAPASRLAVALHELWLAKKPADDIPCRDDFGFEQLRERGLVESIFIVEPIDSGNDWRYRLVGSGLSHFFGRDVTSIPFRDLFVPTEAETCIEISDRVARTRRPAFLRGRVQSFGHGNTFETMSLPIWSRDRSAIWLLGGSFSGLSEQAHMGIFGNNWLN